MKRKKSSPGKLLLFVIAFGIIFSLFADAYAKDINIKIHGTITPLTAAEVVPQINSAKEGDILKIDINSPGGYLNSYYDILGSMNQSKAKSHCTVSTQAASAAAALLVNCDEIIVHEGAALMFHLPYAEFEGFILRDPNVSKMFVISMNAKLNMSTLLGREKYIDMLYGYDILISGREFNNRLLLARVL